MGIAHSYEGRKGKERRGKGGGPSTIQARVWCKRKKRERGERGTKRLVSSAGIPPPSFLVRIGGRERRRKKREGKERGVCLYIIFVKRADRKKIGGEWERLIFFPGLSCLLLALLCTSCEAKKGGRRRGEKKEKTNLHLKDYSHISRKKKKNGSAHINISSPLRKYPTRLERRGDRNLVSWTT